MNSILIVALEDNPLSKEGFLEKIFPNPWDALAVFIAFIILLIVVFYIAYKPVKKLIKARADYVDGKLRNAEKAEEKANTLLSEANEEVKSKKLEGMAIIEKAKQEATKEKELILDDAKKEKQKVINQTKEEIAQEIEASKDELHREIVSVAIDASSKVLEREVNSKDNEKLIDSFIDDLKENK